MINKIYSIITEKTFFVDVNAFKDRDDAFNQCSNWLKDANLITDVDAFKERLYFRESVGSTYMGNYIALPHAKGECIKKPAVLFCRTKETFIYHSNDDEGEVKYIFMIIVPTQASNETYIKILSSLATALMKNEFYEKLDNFQSYKELVECLLEVSK